MPNCSFLVVLLAAACVSASGSDAAAIEAGVVAEGGRWVQDTIAPGFVRPVVIHRIAKHCYSPGVGLIMTHEYVPADSLWRLTQRLLPRLAREASPGKDQYLTVVYLTPGDTARSYMFGFHRSSRTGRWRFMTYSLPSGMHSPELNALFRHQEA